MPNDEQPIPDALRALVEQRISEARAKEDAVAAEHKYGPQWNYYAGQIEAWHQVIDWLAVHAPAQTEGVTDAHE